MYVSTLARWLGLILLLLAAPTTLQADTPVHFIDGIWLSSDEVAAGETVRVYVALRNSAEADIRGVVTMYVGDIAIGSSTVSALPGRLIETWADWQPETVGTYDIRAVLDSLTIHHTTGTKEIDESVVIEHPSVMVITPPKPEPPNNPTTDTPTTTKRSPRSTPVGLEDFLPASRSTVALGQLSERIEVLSKRLEQYEHSLRERSNSNDLPTNPATTSQFSTSASAVAPEANEPRLTPKVNQSSDQATTTVGAMVLGPLWNLLERNALNVWIGIVVACRWLLQNPILVQLILLLGILWLIYRTARHFGKR